MSSEQPELRARGQWPPPTGPRVAIVGARRPTPYGEAAAERLATDLARAGVVVVSGLALGVDAAAHEGALLGDGVTVAHLIQNAPGIAGVFVFIVALLIVARLDHKRRTSC